MIEHMETQYFIIEIKHKYVEEAKTEEKMKEREKKEIIMETTNSISIGSPVSVCEHFCVSVL